MGSVTYATNAKTEWNRLTQTYRPSIVDCDSILFGSLLTQYLPKRNDFNCIEIGGIPGKFLVFLNKTLGYHVTGIDFADTDSFFRDNMALNDVQEYEFIKADFLEFSPARKFDVVVSFGFIEHFEDVEGIVTRHCDLVSDNGYLVITTPNFRYFQYLYHYIFDRANLLIHNTDAMRPRLIDRIVGRHGFKPLFSGHFGHLDVWREPSDLSDRMVAIDDRIQRFVRIYGKRFPTSALYSPHCVGVYRR